MDEVTTNVLFEQRTSRRGFIDVTIADANTIIEQKSLGIDLDKPDWKPAVPGLLPSKQRTKRTQASDIRQAWESA